MTQMNTPTPRTDAAWAKTFQDDEDQCRAGNAATDMRDECAKIETELATLTAERDELRADLERADAIYQRACEVEHQLRAEVERLRSDRDCEKRLRKDAEELREDALERALKTEADLAKARATAELRDSLAIGQDNCDDAYDELATDCAELRADVVRLTARAERAEAELATERARLDYLSTRGFEHRHHETGDHLGYEWTISSYSESGDVTLRDVIDAEMREEAK